MIWMLNIDVAIGAMRSALNPLTCAVEVDDYQKLVRLRVLGPDNTILILLTLSMRDIVDPLTLRSELKQARARVERKGIRLRSWTSPRWQTYIPRAYQSLWRDAAHADVDEVMPCGGADIENI
jgi:hypothetical protein